MKECTLCWMLNENEAIECNHCWEKMGEISNTDIMREIEKLKSDIREFEHKIGEVKSSFEPWIFLLYVLTLIIFYFVKREKFLLENDINERAITHKLAEYIQFGFQDYNVDCEYNRMLGNDEESFVTKKLKLDYYECIQTEYSNVFPDIIIHKRWNNEYNLFIIEVKKKEYAEEIRKKTNETYRNFDKRKINAYMEQLKYKNGIYIEFDWINSPKVEFFS